MGDFDIVIRLKNKITEDHLKILSNYLIQSGFEIRLFPFEKIEEELTDEKMIFLRYCDYTYLLKKAEELKINKRLREEELHKEQFQVDTKSTTELPTDDYKEEHAKHLSQEEQRYKRIKKFFDVKLQLDKNIIRMEKYRKFRYNQKQKFYNSESDREIFEKKFTASEQLMIKFSILNSIIVDEKTLVEHYRELDLIHHPIPLHQKSQKPKAQTFQQYRDYFGDNISIYFAFVEFFQKQLIPLIVVGVFVGILNSWFEHDSHSSPFDSIYSVIVIFWATYFFAKWKKHEREIQVSNCSQGSKQLKKANKMIVSAKDAAQFITKVDYTTGEKEIYFPTSKRLIRYLKGGIQLVPFILGAIAILTASLNIRGYVDTENKFLYIDYLYMMSQPGGFFDKTVWYKKLLATILHVNVFQKLNSYYRVKVEETCKQELHSTHYKKDNSMVFKRFLFEMLYTFTDLSYIAFARLDIEALKRELVAIYSVDEVRRVLTETIIPYITKYKTRKQQEFQREKMTKKTDEQEVLLEYFKEVLLEIQLPKYEQFDDYLEIVINFGYITLFAAAFPYAPLLIYIFNWIELVSDKNKIYYLYQRPQPYKTSGIGIWNTILSFMSVFCVFTNIILFSFSSDQITEFFPNIFFAKPQENLDVFYMVSPPLEGQGRYFVLVVFIIEHLLFAGVYLLRKFLLQQQDWTHIYEERKEYYKKIKYVSQDH